MPALTLQTSHEDSSGHHTSPPKLPILAPLNVGEDGSIPAQSTERPPSPVAPEYSPITPRAQPAVLAPYPPPPDNIPTIISGDDINDGQPPRLQTQITPTVPPAEYIPEPQPQPFSGEDATDAIALRAAISTLQIQKKKAQDDIRTLEKIKKRAVGEPVLFKTELAAGRLHEQKPRVGDLQAVLDHEEDDDDDDDNDRDEQATTGASRKDEEVLSDVEASNGMPNSAVNPLNRPPPQQGPSPTFFDRIPGPQNIVRMPYINWDKYHITGEPLDSLHEQQRKWPGQMAFAQNRGREYAVAAPYSPWLDTPDASGQQRWDRVDSMADGTPTSALTPTGTVSEHPMETRRRTGQ